MSDNTSRARTEIETAILALLNAHGMMTCGHIAPLTKRSESRIVTILEQLEAFGEIVAVERNTLGKVRYRIAEHTADEMSIRS